MIYEARASELRSGLEIAQSLAKMRIGFVVVPALDEEDFSRLAQESARRLNDLVNESEGAPGLVIFDETPPSPTPETMKAAQESPSFKKEPYHDR